MIEFLNTFISLYSLLAQALGSTIIFLYFIALFTVLADKARGWMFRNSLAKNAKDPLEDEFDEI